jgi:hypothetical protein
MLSGFLQLLYLFLYLFGISDWLVIADALRMVGFTHVFLVLVTARTIRRDIDNIFSTNGAQ